MKGRGPQKNGPVQFPAIMGGAVRAVKVAGVNPGQMKFTGALLADI